MWTLPGTLLLKRMMAMVLTNGLLVKKIRFGPVWYTIYHHVYIFLHIFSCCMSGVVSNPSIFINQWEFGTSMALFKNPTPGPEARWLDSAGKVQKNVLVWSWVLCTKESARMRFPRLSGKQTNGWQWQITWNYHDDFSRKHHLIPCQMAGQGYCRTQLDQIPVLDGGVGVSTNLSC